MTSLSSMTATPPVSVTRLLLALAACSALASLGPAAHATEPPMKALERWLTEVGFDDRYGYRPQDRPDANGAIAKLKGSPLDLRLWVENGQVGWRSYRKLNEPHQRCGLAALMDGVSLWMSFKSFEVPDRPIHVWVDCESRGWARVSFRYGPPRDGYDMMKLEVSYGGGVDYSAEAPLRMAASDVKRAEQGPYGVAHEVTLLASQAYRELTVSPGPLDTSTLRDRSKLPNVAASCAPNPSMFEGSDELCATRVESADPQVLGGLAVSQLVEAIHQRWERGERRDGLPGTWVFVHGGEWRWALTRPVNDQEIELMIVRGMVTGEVRRVKVPMPRRTLGTEPTLPTAPRPPGPPPSAADVNAKLAWYGLLTPFVVLAMTGDAEKAQAGAMNLAGLFEHLGPVKAPAGKEPWVTCTPRKGKDPKHCELRPGLELEDGACTALGWALAASVPHVAKPPWTAREEATLALHCGLGEGHRVLAVSRKAVGKNRLVIETELSPPMIAPIDPSKPF